MSESKRSKRHPKALLVALLGGGLMLAGGYFSLFAYQQEHGGSVPSFAAEVAEGLKLPSVAGVFARLGIGSTALQDGMAVALPPGRDGWTRRNWLPEDGDALIAARTVNGGDQAELDGFFAVARGEVPGVLQTYARGDERIAVMIRKLPVTFAGAGAGAGELSLAQREAATRQMLETGAAPIAVHGIALHGARAPAPEEAASFERLRGALAGQISIEVATNTDRAALVKLLSGLDVAALNRFADVPDPLVSAEKGVQLAPGLTPGELAPITADPAVTRGAAPAQAPVGAEAAGEDPVVCIRRAGKRVCD